MPNNMILLETIALTQSAASVTFDNLPTSGYTDLKIVVSNRVNSGGVNIMGMTFNGISTGYSFRNLEGTGSAAGSGGGTSTGGWAGLIQPPSYTANTFSSNEIYIPNYRSSNFKSWSVDSTTENNATASYIELIAGLWSNTAAITSIAITDLGGNSFVAGSTFSLYGIAALGTTPVLAPKATGGNRIENDGTYWIHTFLTSGTFTPQVGLTCDYLVVAGGGAGGIGGGGAGGYRTSIGGSALSVLTQPYAVTVGAGGVGASATSGTSGSDSIFSTITSTGGGGGGFNAVGKAGGSGGGGGSYASQSGYSGGSASPSGQGNAGGLSQATNSGQVNGGGGGGANAAGTNGTANTQTGGNGGAGLSSSLSGTSITYAGGGGGGANSVAGTGGAGGGANGTTSANPAASGTVNTGGGGGGVGTSASATGGNGGSGIVIIRYPIA